jgi:hypothetical protein
MNVIVYLDSLFCLNEHQIINDNMLSEFNILHTDKPDKFVDFHILHVTELPWRDCQRPLIHLQLSFLLTEKDSEYRAKPFQ